MAITDLCYSKTLSIQNDLSTNQSFKEGFRISTFSKRQQRKIKILFLKASRPILRRSNQELSQVSSPSRSPNRKECTVDLPPLLALEALEEARMLRQMKNIHESPLDSAFGAVDWMLDLAHGVQYDWSMFSWLKENSSKKGKIPQEFLESTKEEKVESEPGTEPMYPRCEWPRKFLTSKVDVLEIQDTARCPWPRSSASLTEQNPVTEEIIVTDRNLLEKIYASESNLGQPHCAWPRSSGIDRVTGARCAWPREKVVSATENLVTFVTEKSRDKFSASAAIMPQTASKLTGLETVAGPRCAWPRASSVMAASGDAENVKAISSEVQTAAGPRCQWPRKQKV